MSHLPNTHILINEFAYHEPATLAEASELLLAQDAQIIAGGTDALVRMKMERGAPATLVSLRRIPGLAGISAGRDAVTIGAMTTIAAIASHPLIRTHYIALAEACDAFSTTQVATMGTLGGNIANASPAADSAPTLLSYDAQVVVYGPAGERRVPIADFFVGPGRKRVGARRDRHGRRAASSWPRSRGLVPAVHGRGLSQGGSGGRRHRQGERRDRPDPRRRSHCRRAPRLWLGWPHPASGRASRGAAPRQGIRARSWRSWRPTWPARRSARSTTFARKHGIAARSSA